MDEDFAKMTEEELEAIIRRHENSNVPGSRFQRAMTELDLRYKKRDLKPGIHFEVGGDMTMEGAHVTLPEEGQMTARVKGDLSAKNTKITHGTPTRKRAWFEKPTGIVALGVVAGIIVASLGYMVSRGQWPDIPIISSLFPAVGAKTLDESVFQLVAETDFANTPQLDVQQKWEGYAGLIAGNEQATIVNYGDAGLGKTWVDLRSVGSYNGGSQFVDCVFGSAWQQKIELLPEDASVTFQGTIGGTLDQGGVPVLQNCVLK